MIADTTPRRSRKRPARALALVLALVVAGAGAAAGPDPAGDAPSANAARSSYEPTTAYEVREIEGWSVRVNRQFLAREPELSARTLGLLRDQLAQVVRRLPSRAVRDLRTIRIWVEQAEPHHPCMAYHPDPGWLRDHDMNPEKARCVEVANALNFLDWTRDQPWMVLHELAHGYHHQFLDGGFENREIKDAFAQARSERLYASVLRIDGREEKAYAITDPMEYFAEATEAYFGTNDFYPFVRPELRRHDPRGYALLGRLWGDH